MDNLESIADSIRAELEVKNTVRDQALTDSRTLVRYCANAIRAMHREEWEEAGQGLQTARTAAQALVNSVASHPDLFHSGYIQDALKELAEVTILFSLLQGQSLPSPEALGMPASTYLNGLAEAASELRRTILNGIRGTHQDSVENLLDHMDTIYDLLMSFDFPDAISGGLRHRVDNLRGVLERTRGDLTNSLRQERLEKSLAALEQQHPGG
jgi:translin